MASCEHLRAAGDPRPSSHACAECVRIGSRWVHLRRCLTCGHVGCCDSSPHRHATRHYVVTGHPCVQSFQPDESWRWCFVDEVMDEGVVAPQPIA